MEVSEGPVGIVWGDVPPPFSDPSLGGAVGVFVFSLKPGGRAERAGVLVGDVLVRINGKAVAEGSHEQASREISRCVKAKETISLTVLASSVREVFERRDGRIGITCAPVGISGG
ncbi:hypothetical protein Ctob_000363 [Chrysochromulina tobinii]|uniref:PDZ domain-containing protein n=1 Tax=Chrysochromulina tobinii TaxID=1460289 RepID=A0A0M0J4A5_9EUKA|nr:hypothetical protein Ctob_000363 [Chrysochromulina tobinii]|eukprot:KOO21419.1 hypothetical protein Ctob_000363 [Chrysochromulina sp. CCMP291]